MTMAELKAPPVYSKVGGVTDLSDTQITELEHLEACARRSSDYTAQVAGTAAAALRSIDAAKLNKPENTSAVLPVTGWQKDANDTSGYPYYYDFAVNGVTANDIAHVNIPYSSQAAASECGICPSNSTIAGFIRFYAMSVPTQAISISYWILKLG